MAERGLRFERVAIWRGAEPLVTLDAHIPPGQVLTVMGPSGVGKSTLLAFAIGTLPAAFRGEGSIRLNGRELTGLPTAARKVGILFQDDLLFPHLTVAGNLAFGLPPGTRDRRARVDAALREVGLEDFGPRDPATLSGGQKARVALMRMLLSAPDALLLDEPFARLDADRRRQIRDLVFSAARALPVVMVTHDRADAEAAGGPVIEIGAKPGS